MTLQSKRELIEAIRRVYRKASKRQKSQHLDHLTACNRVRTHLGATRYLSRKLRKRSIRFYVETYQVTVEHSRSHYSLPIDKAEEQLALSEIMSPRAIGAR